MSLFVLIMLRGILGFCEDRSLAFEAAQQGMEALDNLLAILVAETSVVKMW